MVHDVVQQRTNEKDTPVALENPVNKINFFLLSGNPTTKHIYCISAYSVLVHAQNVTDSTALFLSVAVDSKDYIEQS